MTPEENNSRELVVKIARSWLRTKYHHAARIKGVGVDCAMLLAEVYQEAGLMPHIEVAIYHADWHKNHRQEKYLEEVKKHAREVRVPLSGDMAIWQFARTFSHGAIVVKWPLVIHAYLDQPCCLENVNQAHWLKYRGETDSKIRPVKFFRPNQWGDS